MKTKVMLLSVLFLLALSLPLQAAVKKKGRSTPPLKGPFEMTFVLIPAGSFIMGSPADEPGRNNDEQRHQVTLPRPFYLQTTEVTQAQWQAVMGNNPSHFIHCGRNCPVENVSWNDVHAFIRKLNALEKTDRYRLPTEAEWEYAARAGTSTALYSGPLQVLGYHNAPALDGIAWYGGNSCAAYAGAFDCGSWPEKQYACIRCGTHPVGGKQPNAWGLYDMLGNVWEWVQDAYGAYATGPVTDPTGPAGGSSRVFRGGSWNYNVRFSRCAYRLDIAPESRLSFIGFRLVRMP
jgi:formylglycine-generating enzyme required for sulfatase activity